MDHPKKKSFNKRTPRQSTDVCLVVPSNVNWIVSGSVTSFKTSYLETRNSKREQRLEQFRRRIRDTTKIMNKPNLDKSIFQNAMAEVIKKTAVEDAKIEKLIASKGFIDLELVDQAISKVKSYSSEEIDILYRRLHL